MKESESALRSTYSDARSVWLDFRGPFITGIGLAVALALAQIAIGRQEAKCGRAAAPGLDAAGISGQAEYDLLRGELALARSGEVYMVIDPAGGRLSLRIGRAVVWDCPIEVPPEDSLEARGFAEAFAARLDCPIRPLTSRHLSLSADAVPEVPRHTLDLPRLAVMDTWRDTQSAGWVRLLLDNLEIPYIYIGDDELIVGSAGPPGRYAVFYPELEEKFFSQEARPTEPGDALLLTEEDAKIINDELKPYWEGRQIHTAFLQALPEDTRDIVELFFIITPTATARSSLAWNHDYEKVLKRGVKGLRREAEDRLASLDPINPKDKVEKEPFLKAVILVCDAIVAFAGRYAELARSMAGQESNEERRRELLGALALFCQGFQV